MDIKIFIVSVIIILTIIVFTWYVITELQPTTEQLQQGQDNQNSAVVANDTIEDIVSDLNQVADDSVATTELNILDEQLDNF